MPWEQDYQNEVLRTCGRKLVVCKRMSGERFTGWYFFREAGELSIAKYRKSEILSMTETLHARKTK
jgi:hypothetical protein